MSEELHIPHSHGAPVDGLDKWVAILTAVLAMLGGIVGHQANEVANDAILYKNEAVLTQSKAADTWAYYQAASTQSHLTELAIELTPAASHAGYQEKLAKYAKQKEQLQAEAKALEAQVAKDNKKSNALRRPRQTLFLALTIFQIAISVASVIILSRQKWLFGVAVAAALAGIGFSLSALF